MKKITLLFILLVAFNWQSNAQVFTEDFEGGAVPPAGWTSSIGLNGEGATENWKLSCIV